MLKLSIIGSGKVAKTMAYLWHQAGCVEILDVVNRSQKSANQSTLFIGAGNALCSLSKINTADIFIIGCGDDDIEGCLEDLLKQNVIQANTIVVHFSGAKSSTILSKAKTQGGICASLHPVKSFANPELSIQTFENTYCGLEGDTKACEVLENLIDAIGGHCFKVDSDKKLTYHAASVFASNYLVALQELSIRAFEYSGVERELALKILQPIVKETAENVSKLGTAKALTGPIARGDYKLVAEQFDAVKQWNSDAAEIYRLLGNVSTDLSIEGSSSDKADLEDIKKLLE